MDPTVAPPTTTTTTATTTDDDDSPNNPTTNIIKRKRTKRQRPTFVPQSSTSYNALNSSPATFSDSPATFSDSPATFSDSPATSSDSPATSTTTEDEDTANCLILLSKGHNNNNNIVTHRNNNNNNNNNIIVTGEKFNSKRYIQTSTDDGLYGVYVYDCKTCGRTFSSFQALGGHRASHKKPKLVNEKAPPCTAVSDDDEHPSRRNHSSSSSSISLQLHHRNSTPATIKKHLTSKLHDCSICGAEFTSGQALGGHMRRHRPITTVAVAGDVATDTTLSLVPYTPVTTVDDGDDGGDEDDQRLMMNDGLCLDLDLNLPAPPEITVAAAADRRSFKFTGDNIQKKQQSTVHLSAAPTLVDCHY